MDATTKQKRHQQMLETIRTEAKFTATYTGRTQFSESVMQAMQEVDRSDFVDGFYKLQAFENGPLPIGHGQTISQPYIVALMTDLLELTPESVVLEIGTGSGYQAAILSRIAKQVYSVEKIPELAEAAAQRLQALGYTNINTRCDNGYYGWREKAPFDGIIVTAAASHVPQDLVEQLKPGARMVIPVGQPYMSQVLILLSKDAQGDTQAKSILDVVFVPLVSEHARTPAPLQD
jgi:protein-L-isoaspartate(D-aspartate) O-methyltransferase